MSEKAAVWEDINVLVPWSDNPRHNQSAIQSVADSIKRFGFASPIIAREADKMIIAGHTRLEAAKSLGLDRVPVRYLDLDPADAKMLALADNKIGEIADWDEAALEKIIDELSLSADDMADLGWGTSELDDLFESDHQHGRIGVDGSIRQEYLEPPFSVLYARGGEWQDRKRLWKSFGLSSEKGRSEGLIGPSDMMADRFCSGGGNGTSVFDPVLCELMYMWFTPKGASVLDPFAGGAVRGVVASVLGRSYLGVDIREEQVAENRRQAEKICNSVLPEWICGDSAVVLPTGDEFDFILTCPPYHNLEVYSSNEKDISNMTYEEFLSAYNIIVEKACSTLRCNRFAVVVVGEIRNKGGYYRSFVSDTIKAFEGAGLAYYNEMILVTKVATNTLRAPRIFRKTRKVGKTHQNVLVFVKGCPKEATNFCGHVEILAGDGLDG